MLVAVDPINRPELAANAALVLPVLNVIVLSPVAILVLLTMNCVPSTYRSPDTYAPPPTNNDPPMPTPPATCNAPEVVDIAEEVLVNVTINPVVPPIEPNEPA